MLEEKDRAIGKVLISWFTSFEHFSVQYAIPDLWWQRKSLGTEINKFNNIPIYIDAFTARKK